jgi:hypothetical protein
VKKRGGSVVEDPKLKKKHPIRADVDNFKK